MDNQFDKDLQSAEQSDVCEEAQTDTCEEAQRVPKKRTTVGLFTLIFTSVACLIVGAAIALMAVPNSLRMWIGGSGAYDKLLAIEQIVNKNFKYIDGVSSENISDMVAWGYVYALGDPYSAYYDAEQFTAVQYSNAGQTYGIGISGAMYEQGGGIYIARITKNSPAEAAGLQKGDIIAAVEGVNVTTENYDAQINAIRGKIGTAVKLTVKRDQKAFEISVTRDEFIGESVWGEMLGSVGYIAVCTFNDATLPQFNDVLDAHIAAGATSLIIDLRDNTGGLVSSANELLDRLLPECDLGYAVYQDSSREVLGRSDKECVDLPIAVIVNSRTASSSEIVAAALNEVAGAKLIGEKTFGKGIMQSTYPLGDGSAVRVTVAEIYTAGGNQYHGKGLEVDIAAGYTDEQQEAWFLLSGAENPYIAAALESLK